MRVGVLALQGGFAAHGAALADLGHTPVEIRGPESLDTVEGLVLPGGESTAQLRLIDRLGLHGPLDAFVRSGRPVLATCAGVILAARAVEPPGQVSFGWLDLVASRNAYGRQLNSFEARSDPPLPDPPLPLVFIRAPRLVALGDAVEVLATQGGEPVLVRQGAWIAATFHPELTPDRRVHAMAFPRR